MTVGKCSSWPGRRRHDGDAAVQPTAIMHEGVSKTLVCPLPNK